MAQREQFLHSGETAPWPDRVGARYGFRHALYQQVLYQQVLYQRVASARRVQLHQRVGEQQERAYGERAEEIAAELALRFEQGRDYWRAVRYLHRVGENALRRSAHREALEHLSKGLELLKTLPDTPERARLELQLQIALGVPLAASKGYAAPELEKAYLRARELCQQLGEAAQLSPALWGLWVFHFVRAELQTARELGAQLLRLAQRSQTPDLLPVAYEAVGTMLFHCGEIAPAARAFEQGWALYDPRHHSSYALLPGFDPEVICLSYLALAAGLSRSGTEQESRGALSGSTALAPEQPGLCALLYGFMQSALSARAENPRAGRGSGEAIR